MPARSRRRASPLSAFGERPPARPPGEPGAGRCPQPRQGTAPAFRDAIGRACGSQPLRFLAVGACNTGLAYLVFALLYFFFSPYAHYLAILAASAVVNVTIAFVGYKFIVFRTRGNYLREYLRFYGVYAVPIGLGVVLLTFAIEVLEMNAYLAQGLITIGMAVVSYLGHKHISFRRPGGGPRP